MIEHEMQTAMRYVAFISYSHADREHARWLHRAIESFRIPRRLKVSGSEVGERLAPVFLDQDELSSSPDLGETVRGALAQSRFLIVLCSPAAARSRWVNEEIRAFKTLGGESRILCVLAGGEPGAEARGLSADVEALPPALRYRVVDGQITAEPVAEPLACDLRAGRRARRDVRLRVAAALLGVPFDTLRQREHARRQRRLAWLAAASTLGCVVLAALAVTAWLARNQAERERLIAQQKSLTAERTTAFLVDLFKVSDPSEARGNSVTAREILDRGVRQIDESLQSEPSVRAELLSALGQVYTGLGLFATADELLTRAAAPGAAAGTATEASLALAELEFQRGNFALAAARLDEAEKRRARDPDAGADVLAKIMLGRGEIAAVEERADDARRFFSQALAATGADAPLSEVGVRAAEGLALATYFTGDLEAARSQYEAALRARIELSGETHPHATDSLNQLGLIAYELGDSAEAERYVERALEIDTRVLGPKHPNLAATQLSLGRLRLERREYREAGDTLAAAIEVIRAQSSAIQPDLVFGYSNLGLAQIALQQLGPAAESLEKALTAARANGSPLEGPIRSYQGDVACRTGAPERGLELLAEAQALIAAHYPDDAWRSALVDNVRAECLDASGRSAEGRELFEQSAPVVLARWPTDTAFGSAVIERALRIYGRHGDDAALARYRALAR